MRTFKGNKCVSSQSHVRGNILIRRKPEFLSCWSARSLYSKRAHVVIQYEVPTDHPKKFFLCRWKVICTNKCLLPLRPSQYFALVTWRSNNLLVPPSMKFTQGFLSMTKVGIRFPRIIIRRVSAPLDFVKSAVALAFLRTISSTKLISNCWESRPLFSLLLSSQHDVFRKAHP